MSTLRLLAGTAALAAVLSLSSCGAQARSSGAACATRDDCDPGLECVTNGFPGGYCARGCTMTGGTNECPTDTVCAELTSSARRCGRTCATVAQCRAGYECAAAPNSTLRVCKPGDGGV